MVAALCAGIASISTKANAVREKVADELYHDTDAFWAWWDKTAKDKRSLNVTICGELKSGKTTLGTRIYFRETGILPDKTWSRPGHPTVYPVIMFEDDGPLSYDRTHYFKQGPGVRVNIRRAIPCAVELQAEADHSDLVLFTYRLPNTDKFRVRVLKNRFGSTDNLVFCLS